MNHLQELILDRLIGTPKIGRYWTNGPLALAVQALKEKQLTTNSDATQALGFPMAMCEALQGANSVLRDMEQRREQATAFFSEVAPGFKRPRLAPNQHIGLGAWAVHRVHPLFCTDQCSVLRHLSELVRRYGPTRPINWPYHISIPRERHCPRLARRSPVIDEPERSALMAAYSALVYLLRAFEISPEPQAIRYGPRVQRDAARVAALLKGKDGALDYCLALARELGLMA